MKRLFPFIAILALAACNEQTAVEPASAPAAAVASGAPVVKIATLEQLPAPLPKPYDDSIKPAAYQAAIDAALVEAKASNKRVIVDFGGNWCSWCRGLAGVMDLPEVKPFIDANFEVVHVSVGPILGVMNVPKEVGARFGVEKIDGTPFLVIAEPDGAVVVKSSEVTDQAHETPQAMVNWLAQHAKPAVQKAPA